MESKGWEVPALIRGLGQLIVFPDAGAGVLCFRICARFTWTESMRVIVVCFALLFAGIASAQSPASSSRAEIRFMLENPRLEPAAYTLEIFEDGTGSYSESAGGADASAEEERAIHIHDPLLSKLFAVARSDHFFAMDCEAPREHVAFTGKKTLAYAGADGDGSCTFNFSRDQSLNRIVAELMSIAYTLEEGARLKSEHLYDRLSLDAELESLKDAAQDHRALELENIAPELESIADDEAVMQRARMRARALLSEPLSSR
jgi:hypothetical protein